MYPIRFHCERHHYCTPCPANPEVCEVALVLVGSVYVFKISVKKAVLPFFDLNTNNVLFFKLIAVSFFMLCCFFLKIRQDNRPDEKYYVNTDFFYTK